ncbi:isoquinoline 1-oxidoreductase, alpha subunit [Actinokineospora alba]|uniref:Isoquinoline 1-oxidoreductase, alpha subunit n=1 Tax=Actinokineospora alba TaxID=504798 RepID=A0A1H0R070_9PSEU|nr:(2Fe-2S)-binding protein [Actinokineospora alba]TDP70307.1 isoquinoline 1-oxidoreductase alpha subunit [Actinokineospora alba]SDI34505.1 isoquinoline 1-oxidoreductase, alpha subunit [Actinokineospora alba]SDP22962.1 isoquinoline 1-oxidoreductase, alpha subunit [Actinokineospora alba]
MPTYRFNVNGKPVAVDAPADTPLLWVLRERLGLTGPKYGCGVGACRACTSHLDGKEFQPCTVAVSECNGRKITTIEGLADGDELHPVQQAWLDEDVAQCGFCQPGQIMAAAALLKTTKTPTDAEIDAIENVCRCGTYCRIRDAIKRASAAM